MMGGRSVVFGLLFLLPACGGPAQTPASVTDLPTVISEEVTSEELASEEATSEIEMMEDVSAPQVPAPAKQEVALRHMEVNDNPDQFLGASLSMVNEKIGIPFFARRDGQIEVWQYRRQWQGGLCHLDLFLYPIATETGTEIKVKFADLRSQHLNEQDQRACFAEMLRDHLRRRNISPIS